MDLEGLFSASFNLLLLSSMYSIGPSSNCGIVQKPKVDNQKGLKKKMKMRQRKLKKRKKMMKDREQLLLMK